MSYYCVELCEKFDIPSVNQLTWAHAVNSEEKLNAALASDVHMIEADLTLGEYCPDLGKAGKGGVTGGTSVAMQYTSNALKWVGEQVAGSASSANAKGDSGSLAGEAERKREKKERKERRRREEQGEGNPDSARSGKSDRDRERRKEASARKLPGDVQVIMAHPPMVQSNLTLERFLKRICAYNQRVAPGMAERRLTQIREGSVLLEGVDLTQGIESYIGDVEEGNDVLGVVEEGDEGSGERSGSGSGSDGGGAGGGSVRKGVSGGPFNRAGDNPQANPNGNGNGLKNHASYLENDATFQAMQGALSQANAGLGIRQKRLAKGVKLDFKNLDAVKPAIELLLRHNASANMVACWLNGDVAEGPGCPPINHLDGKKFLKICCKVPDVVLSLGWLSTELGMTQVYSQTMIKDMLELVQIPYLRCKGGARHTVAAVAHHITFCVQAKFAMQSNESLLQLLDQVPNSSLTVFTGVGTTGISASEHAAIEDAFDVTRLFVDVYTRQVGDGIWLSTLAGTQKGVQNAYSKTMNWLGMGEDQPKDSPR